MSGIVWIIAVVAVVGLYVWYVAIVKRKNRVAEALSGIDVQLSQRHELIPNVLAIAKRYLAHEQTLLADIARLRTTGQERLGSSDPKAIAEKFAAENQLGVGLGRLFAVAEGYPELKSDALMVKAQATYQEVETNVAAARRFYNASVTALRNACQIFPGQLVAGLAGVGQMPPFFEAPVEHRGAVNAADHL
ncbi:MAG: LemA family protein [Alphaproteobacteria bacterium]|nr:LemA family protein [Alphaproteobacteria bacterium]MBU1515967.1 LemA family protein [Alphaproteobacteria bacterium]MBU2092818.1 LemA family protein [Alphaproteobacteria bacterium]MBU2153657.1 LemA family protein [Alphaproteobacteria bacterium]MBU2308285.1 LemA family protein [Alphaproteobacteria bacterium]